MLLTTLLLMQGQVLAPAENGEGSPVDWSKLFPAGPESVTIMGRFQQDFAWIDDDNAPFSPDGSEARRARIGIGGDLAEDLKFKMEVDFASFNAGGTAFTDAYLQFTNLAFGSVKIGHFKEPFGLNELTSSRFVTIVERADTFAPARNTGIMAADSTDQMTWQVGAFWETDKHLDSGNSAAYTGRFVFRPMMEDKGKSLIHLGGAISIRENEAGAFTADSSGGVHLLNKDQIMGTIAADDLTLVNLEAAWQEGPVHAQAEFSFADGDDDSFTSFYVQGGYFLTGESRGYKASSAAFSRVTPNTPWGGSGNGAWEIAGRVQVSDFADGPGNAGQEMTAIAVALNWYLTSHTRIMFDVFSGDSDALGEDVLAGVVRFGIDW